jgi:hypothetical protein
MDKRGVLLFCLVMRHIYNTQYIYIHIQYIYYYTTHDICYICIRVAISYHTYACISYIYMYRAYRIVWYRIVPSES